MENKLKLSREENSVFYSNLWKLALPIIIQNFITSSINMISTLLVGRLGQAEVAAVGIANQYFFLFDVIIIGLCSGCGVFISQYYGSGNKEKIKKVMGVGMISVIILALVFMLFAIIMPQSIVSIFNNDSRVVSLGSDYLIIICFSYVFTGITFLYSVAARCISKTVLPMIVSSVALIFNTILSLWFIFGGLGLEAMGVKGAALATLIARIIECFVLLLFIYRKKYLIAATVKEMRSVDRLFIKESYYTILPVLFNDLFWGLGAVVYNIAYGKIGVQAMAAIQICTTIQNIFMVVSIGMASACAVIIGNTIGAGEYRKSKIYAKKFAILSIVIGGLVGGLLIILAPYILSMYKASPGLYYDSLKILYVLGAVFVIRVYNIVLVLGILRGGGDAKFALFAESLTMWGIGVPAAFIGALVFKLPIYGVAGLVALEEIVKLIIATYRLKGSKWINDLTKAV
ncbi:MATE family efflux transporter [Clostridium cylindrosporum]|uniref:Probable multidrug resistance protein NorM n=1 Tax=Clostridium cylindrosporum DSM 605 TaxID=1121307 RepID=A0A0J8DAT2_CLOCY|nr:MATE family efflux transporter [Clostridium cylindrosporum]KMT23155.1 MATE efflux family protein [Clostridium cylindrosporum DSM 605]